jgi:hypothetical protein
MVEARAAALAALSLLAGGVAAPAASAAPAGAELFVDRAAEVGIDFVHFNGMSGELYFVEMAGGGAALFDYDRDGDLDVYLVQGTMLGDGKTLAEATFEPAHPLPLVDRLYRNDLEVRPDGTRSLKFTDVTAESGIVSGGYGMGVAVGDYDNDGWPDLYVTNFGPNQMWRNDGDGTFSDVTDATGTDDPRWSVPAVFFDYDADGWLDLYVGNYVDYRIATHKTCNTVAGLADYCGPRSYAPVPGRLFHNRGRGEGGVTFEDVTAREGIAAEFGPALGATASDFDGDGRIDLYVANDGSANQLWLNRPGADGRARFVNEALLAGCAVNEAGQPEASMGVIAGDFSGDGSPDLFMTHLARETNTLYVNDGSGLFEDRSQESGLGPPSWEGTGFGTALIDYDNDGWIDLFVANGAVTLIQEQVRSGEVYALKQRNQLYRNLGAGRFEEVPAATAGEELERMEVSRGVALGDVDNDGDSDLLLANNAGPARLLVNQVGQDRPWLGLRLVGGEPPRDQLGARATLYRQGAPPLVREARTDGSFASAGDPRVLFGLGRPAGGAAAGHGVEKVRVRWPSGRVEEWTGLPTGAYTTLREGTGEPIAP